MITCVIIVMFLLPYLFISFFKALYYVIKRKLNHEEIKFINDTESNTNESKRINYYGMDDEWGKLK